MIGSFRKFAIEAGFIALWIFVLASSPLLAAGDLKTVEIEALRITVDSEWATRVTPGYWPIRFDITNLGDDRTIEILGQGTRWWNSGESGAAEIHQTLKLKRADRKRFTVSVPIFANNENLSFQIRERGKTLQVFSYSSLESGRSADESSVLVVGDSASPYGTAASSWLRPLPAVGRFGPGGPIPRGAGTVPRLDLMLDVSRLPTDWLGFTSLRAVFIGPDQWRALENTQRDALLTWVACGGDLIFVDGDPSTLIPEAKEAAGTISLDAPLRTFWADLSGEFSRCRRAGNFGCFVRDAQNRNRFGLCITRQSRSGLAHLCRTGIPPEHTGRWRRARSLIFCNSGRLQRVDWPGELCGALAKETASAARPDHSADFNSIHRPDRRICHIGRGPEYPRTEPIVYSSGSIQKASRNEGVCFNVCGGNGAAEWTPLSPRHGNFSGRYRRQRLARSSDARSDRTAAIYFRYCPCARPLEL